MVTGTVTYQGQPIEGARVMFQAEEARPASGTTDAEGRFTLTTFETDDGAVVGKHTVSITKSAPADPNDPYAGRQNVLPGNYASGRSSPLTADVTEEGPNDFPFALTD